MTILDCCVSLKMIKKFLVVLGVVNMRQLLLKGYVAQAEQTFKTKLEFLM